MSAKWLRMGFKPMPGLPVPNIDILWIDVVILEHSVALDHAANAALC